MRRKRIKRRRGKESEYEFNSWLRLLKDQTECIQKLVTLQLSATRAEAFSILFPPHFLRPLAIAKPLVSIPRGQFKVTWRLTYGISKSHFKDYESVQMNPSYVSPWY